VFIFKVVDGDVSLKVFVEYVVPFLLVEGFIDCCSFDVVREFVLGTSLDEF